MFVFIGEQQRVLAHHGPKDLVAFAGVQVGRVGGKDLLDVYRPVEHHEVVCVGRNAEGEDVTMTASHDRKEPRAAALKQDALYCRWPSGTRVDRRMARHDSLVNEALGQCFGMWNQRVEDAFEAGLKPRDQLAAILRAAIDSLADLRSSVHACVESYAPALRSEELRERLAAGYAAVRESGVSVATKHMEEVGMAAPNNLATITSVLMAVCDGLMLQMDR